MKNIDYLGLTLLYIAIFVSLLYYYSTLYNQLGIQISKASAALININLLLILISSSKFTKRIFYLSTTLFEMTHIFFATNLIIWSIVHCLAHYINFSKNNITNRLVNSGVGLTGHFIVFCLIGIVLSSRYIKINYSYFLLFHNIVTVIICILICLHGSFCTIKNDKNKTCPEVTSWKWLITGITVLVGEFIYKYNCTYITSNITRHKGNIIELKIKLPEYFCGKTCWINSPNIHLLEWHPFTSTLYNNNTSEISFHIKIRGDWTNKLDKNVMLSNIKLKLDGPYHCIPKDFLNTLMKNPSVLITTGIGITKFSRILQKLINVKEILIKMYLVVVVKHPSEIIWLIPIISQLHQCHSISVSFFFTDKNLHINYEDLIDFNFEYALGRPNFQNIFDNIFINLFFTNHPFVNVFYSGRNDIFNNIKQITQIHKTFHLHNV